MRIIDSYELIKTIRLLEKITEGKPFQRADLIHALNNLYVIKEVMAKQNIVFEADIEIEQ